MGTNQNRKYVYSVKGASIIRSTDPKAHGTVSNYYSGVLCNAVRWGRLFERVRILH